MPKRSLNIGGRDLVLDARPDKLDLRDLPYRPPLTNLPDRYPSPQRVAEYLPMYFDCDLILDQGKEGACTGFGLAAVINYLLWLRSGKRMKAESRASPWMLYRLARFYDEWPGEDYEGSSCRGALKGWHRHGVCLHTLWSLDGELVESDWAVDALQRPLGVYYRVEKGSVVDIQSAICNTGAVYVSANVHQGWDLRKTKLKSPAHETLPVVETPSRPQFGGHAFALVGYNERGFIVQNSWGREWGAGGFAVLPYEDWVVNGTDAWAVALGAPIASQLTPVNGKSGLRKQARARRFLIPSAAALTLPGGRALRATGDSRALGWFGERDPLEKAPHAWPEDEAYEHTLVTGNDGLIVNCLLTARDEKAAAMYVCRRRPADWFREREDGPKRLVVYAHGGLNSQEDSIRRIRMMGPCFEQNGIYPVFITWRSGWKETLQHMLEDGAKAYLGTEQAEGWLREKAAEVRDRTLETALRFVLGKSLWREMKENVERAVLPERGLTELAKQIKDLQQDFDGKIDVHLVGHSAGAIVCAHLIRRLAEKGLKVASCSLYAPACDVTLACESYKPAVEQGTLPAARFNIHVLADKLELDDTVGPYGKSLLYLVSRALERVHKTPLLGLEKAFDAACATDEHWHESEVASVETWQKFVAGGGAKLHVLKDSQVSVARRKKIKSTHGCFDNATDIVGGTIAAMLGVQPSDLAHPPDALDF